MTRWIPRRHARWIALASAYVDDELNDRARFEDHLSRCARCEDAVDEMRSIRALVVSLPSIPAPHSFRLTPAMLDASAPTAAKSWPVLLRLAQVTTVAAIIAAATVFSLDLTSGGNSAAPAAGNHAVTMSSAAGAAPVASPTAPGASPPSAVPTEPPAIGTAQTIPYGSKIAPVGPIASATAESAGADGIAPIPAQPTIVPQGCTVDSSGACSVGGGVQPTAVLPQSAEKSAERRGSAVRDFDSTYSGGTSDARAWYRPTEFGLVCLAALALVASVALDLHRRR